MVRRLRAYWRTPNDICNEQAPSLHYELDTWERSRLPLRQVGLAGERWGHDGAGGGSPPNRIGISVNYQDGFGRTLQSKALVDAGPAIARDASGDILVDPTSREPLNEYVETRWLVSGHSVYNNKQQMVRQFEPFYSGNSEYEPDDILQSIGHSILISYDALGREIRRDFPNGTVTYAVASAWHSEQYDPNDAVVGSRYADDRSALASTDLEHQALRKSLAHRNTPVLNHIDGLSNSCRRGS